MTATGKYINRAELVQAVLDQYKNTNDNVAKIARCCRISEAVAHRIIRQALAEALLARVKPVDDGRGKDYILSIDQQGGKQHGGKVEDSLGGPDHRPPRQRY